MNHISQLNPRLRSHTPENCTNGPPCDKYVSRLMRQDKYRKSLPNPTISAYNEKVGMVQNKQTGQTPPPPPQTQTSPIQNRLRSMKNRHPSPTSTNHSKHMTTILAPHHPPLKEPEKESVTSGSKVRPTRHRSISSCSSHRGESWGQLLNSNKSREHVSSFSNFDPLRTLHFLSKELHFKLQTVLPGHADLNQIVHDIQHALKRIPPEVASLIHIQSGELKSLKSDPGGGGGATATKNVAMEVSNKSCQTPPTLYQEDSESFQKMMEENTHKLAISCQQLEMVCTNLQQEKEISENELELARQTINMMRKKIADLETRLENCSPEKFQQLEEDKRKLQEKVQKVLDEINDNATVSKLKKIIEDMRSEKCASEQAKAKLEYDLALVTLENEKFAKMLSVRDKEIKEIQDEMSKIQEQVTLELKKLHSEVLSRAASVKSLADDNNASQNGGGSTSASSEESQIGIGDASISTILSGELSDKSVAAKTNNKGNEGTCGGDGAELAVAGDGSNIKKNAKFDLPTSEVRDDSSLQELLKNINAATATTANLSKRTAAGSKKT